MEMKDAVSYMFVKKYISDDVIDKVQLSLQYLNDLKSGRQEKDSFYDNFFAGQGNARENKRTDEASNITSSMDNRKRKEVVEPKIGYNYTSDWISRLVQRRPVCN